jgi:hypothetical protein
MEGQYVEGVSTPFSVFVPDDVIAGMEDRKCNGSDYYMTAAAMTYTFLKELREEPGDVYTCGHDEYTGPTQRLDISTARSISFQDAHNNDVVFVYDLHNCCFIDRYGQCLYIKKCHLTTLDDLMANL